MKPAALVLLLIAGCQVPSPAASAGPRQWALVERAYDEVEHWIQDSGDADLARGETTLVFEPVEVEGDERLRLLLQASRCAHHLRCSGEIPDRQQVGDPVELTLSIACDPQDVHRFDVIPTRPGVQVIAICGAMDELPNLSGFHVRGSEPVTIKFTATSGGPGGIRAILSEVASSK